MKSGNKNNLIIRIYIVTYIKPSLYPVCYVENSTFQVEQETQSLNSAPKQSKSNKNEKLFFDFCLPFLTYHHHLTHLQGII